MSEILFKYTFLNVHCYVLKQLEFSKANYFTCKIQY